MAELKHTEDSSASGVFENCNNHIREKLVELMAERCEFKRRRCVGCGLGLPEAADCKVERFGETVDHLIANGVTVQEWIPVSERLPSDEKDVLVYYGFGDLRFMHMGILSYYCFDPNPHWQHESTGMKITHWMPLPEAPKGE